jgi:hypothetical protein
MSSDVDILQYSCVTKSIYLLIPKLLSGVKSKFSLGRLQYILINCLNQLPLIGLGNIFFIFAKHNNHENKLHLMTDLQSNRG